MGKLLRGLLSATSLRYLLAAAGGALVASGKVDAAQWETISGAVMVIVPLVIGAISSQQSRVVTDTGKKVPISALPHQVETLAREKAETVAAERPSILARLRGLFVR